MTIYFTSDTHYFHKNILQYCNRPWSTVEEMNQALIDNYNSRVMPDDDVYHLGDFTLTRKQELIVPVLAKLNGRIHLIKGNHDKWTRDIDGLNAAINQINNDFSTRKIVSVRDYYEFHHDGLHFVLSHFPMMVWHNSQNGSVQLHGHSHGSLNYLNTNEVRRMDVGVDAVPNKYFPISIGEVSYIMKNRGVQTLDHHGQAN